MPAIRKLEHDDFQSLLIIETESFFGGYSPYFIKMIPILFGNTSYISIEGHIPQGYVTTAIEQGNPRRAWILSLAVRPQYRQQGIAKALLETTLNRLIDLGAKEVLLSVAPDNTPALALYLQFGFNANEKVSNYYGPAEDRIIMQKSFLNEK